MGYLSAKQVHSDTLEMESGLLRRRVSRYLEGGIWMPESEFGCPRGHLNTLSKLLHGGYPDAKTYIRIYIKAIRILEESIRIPATGGSRTAMKQ